MKLIPRLEESQNIGMINNGIVLFDRDKNSGKLNYTGKEAQVPAAA
ncbi:MAG: hypothetical protein WD426_06800 [Anditalea sp.]